MGGFATLNTAVSGLNTAQAGLYVSGHNMSNVNTAGFTRQQVIQKDNFYQNIGKMSNGTMQLGLGTNIASIRQIRDRFLDSAYRTSASKIGYYSTTYTAGLEIESIIGETEGAYRFQDILFDLKNSLQELSKDPSGIDTRGDFISTAIIFVDKANDMFDSLRAQQDELNKNIIAMVDRINVLLEDINMYNSMIPFNEVCGDNANDFRDARNLALDELSGYLNISYKTNADGSISINCEGNELLSNGMVNYIGLRYCTADCHFVEPVFAKSKNILPFDPAGSSAKLLFKYDREISSQAGTDNGALRGMLVARGTKPMSYADTLASLVEPVKPNEADYITGMYPDPKDNPDYIDDMKTYAEAKMQYDKDKFNMEYAMIPKTMRNIDTLVHSIVTLINNTFAPRPDAVDGVYTINTEDSPYGLDGEQYFMEVFVRKGSQYRYDENTGELLAEDPDDKFSLYTIGNFILNPELRNRENYKKLTLSQSGGESDMQLILDVLEKWDSQFISIDGGREMGVSEFYSSITSELWVETNMYKTISESEAQVLLATDNKRLQISGVSLDEEMTDMLKYQHSYNAAARIVNVVDSMIDRIINNMGRSGL